MRQIKELDFIINKKGTIGRIMLITKYKVKIRCVSPCRGEYTTNIGTPYTHQTIILKESLKKSWKLLSTEKLLNDLFEVYKK